MIKSKAELKRYIKLEKRLYIEENVKERIIQYLTNENRILIWKYVKLLRKTEYYYNQDKSLLRNICYTFYRRKKNKIGIKLGIEMWENSFEEGLLIYHNGGIVINGGARIGKDCKLHGDNCIGNNGINFDNPKIGNNVDIGVGAKIIGNVYIADNIKIGAGAIVNKSFLEEGITIAGVPAKKVKDKNENTKKDTI